MKRRVDQYGEWTVLDASSLDTEIEIEGVNALHWPVYRHFRRDAIAIGVEALLDVICEAFKGEPDFDLITAADDLALARIADLSQLDLITCIRIGFTIVDGWFDSFQNTVHHWQGSLSSEEQKLGRRAMRTFTACRMRFELADRAPVGSDIERAKELHRRMLPCTSDELNRAAAAQRISAKTMQRARTALGVSGRKVRNEHGRVIGHYWTPAP